MNKYNDTYHNFSSEELNNLLNLSLSGNSDSFTKLSNIVRNIAFNYFELKYKSGKLKNIEDAEDMANNVYITFAEQYQNIQNIEHWLRRVLFLMFVNWYKKQKKHPHFELNEAYNANPEILDLDSSVDSLKVVEIMNEMNERKRTIIKLRFWEGLKFSEIAEKLDKNEAAVKKMLYRTLEEIKEKLE